MDTERELKPEFVNKEIVVAMPEQQGFGMAVEECVAEILYLGKEQEESGKFKVGDKILFDRKAGREINFFKEKLWKIDGGLSVICKIV